MTTELDTAEIEARLRRYKEIGVLPLSHEQILSRLHELHLIAADLAEEIIKRRKQG